MKKQPTMEEIELELRLRTPHFSDKENYVYVINGGRLKKVGRSVGVDKRLRDLSAMSPVELRLERTLLCPGKRAPQVERFLHVLLDKKRHHGEWFAISPNELDKRLLIALRKFSFIELDFADPVDRSSCLWSMIYGGRRRPLEHPDLDWLIRSHKDYYSHV